MTPSCFIICCSLLQLCIFGTASSLSCKPELEVAEGEPMELKSYSDVPIDSCEFFFPGLPTKIRVFKGVQNKKYEFAGNFKEGVCGIRFASAKRELQGQVTCRVSFPRIVDFEEANTNVTVYHSLESINMETNGKYWEFKEGQQMRFNCTCSLSNPPPNLTLYVGELELEAVDSRNYVISSKVADVEDFDKKVTCIARHPHFRNNEQLIFARPLTIFFSPRFSGEHSVEGEWRVGAKVSIKVAVSAYPMPHTHRWTTLDGKYLDRDRFTSRLERTQNITQWDVYLEIEEIRKEDLRLGFTLTVANEEGQQIQEILPDGASTTFTDYSLLLVAFFVLCSFVILITVALKKGVKLYKNYKILGNQTELFLF